MTDYFATIRPFALRYEHDLTVRDRHDATQEALSTATYPGPHCTLTDCYEPSSDSFSPMLRNF